MALDLQKLLEDNKNLPQRMREEDWDISYNKNADMLLIVGKPPANSAYHYVGDNGFMVRVGADDNVIYGFGIENYKKFEELHADFALVFMPIVHPLRYAVLRSVVRIIDKVSQLNEAAEFLSGAAVYGGRQVAV